LVVVQKLWTEGICKQRSAAKVFGLL
jgi:hypothetical protein